MALKNPFAQGTTEAIEGDQEFLNLFGSTIVERVPWQSILEKPLTYWAGAQGGGKSSLLRLITPTVLASVANREHSDPLRRLLEENHLIKDGRPALLGIPTKGTVTYKYIEDMALDASKQRPLFFALLNSRIIQRFVKSLATLREIGPAELGGLTFDLQAQIEGMPSDMPRSGTAVELQAWAIAVEQRCLEVIQDSELPNFGHYSYVAQRVCDTRFWHHKGQALPMRSVIIIDDGQELTKEQRTWIQEACTREREGARTWVAVRLHALESPAVFHGASEGREYKVVRLESLWVDNHQSHEEFVRDVLVRRLQQGSSRTIRSPTDLVQDRCSFPDMEEVVEPLLVRVRGRVMESVRETVTYREWCAWADEETDSFERLLRWRELEIHIAREKNSSRLDLGQPLARQLLLDKHDPVLRRTALFLMARETSTEGARRRIPMYFGVDSLVYVGLHNVQLMILACERLYDEALDKELRARPTRSLNAREQDTLLREFVDGRWKAIQEEYARGRTMQDLLSVFCQRLSAEVAKPNAPYPPGPVGLGLAQAEFDILASPQDELALLQETLDLCLAYNFLNVAPRKHKSQPYQILFVSPIALMTQGLPVQSRQFQPTSLTQLDEWLRTGFVFSPAAGKSQANRIRKPSLPSPNGSARIDDFGGDVT